MLVSSSEVILGLGHMYNVFFMGLYCSGGSRSMIRFCGHMVKMPRWTA